MSALAWNDLSKAERKEVERLSKRHRDIVVLGAGALEKQRQKEAQQERRQEWVTKYGLKCFGCQAAVADWGKLGVTNGRRWAICMACVWRRRPTNDA